MAPQEAPSNGAFPCFYFFYRNLIAAPLAMTVTGKRLATKMA